MIDPREWPHRPSICRAVEWGFRDMPGVDVWVLRAASALNRNPLDLACNVLDLLVDTFPARELNARRSGMLSRAMILAP